MTDFETVRRLTNRDHASKEWLKAPHPLQRVFDGVCFLIAGLILGGVIVFALYLATV